MKDPKREPMGFTGLMIWIVAILLCIGFWTFVVDYLGRMNL